MNVKSKVFCIGLNKTGTTTIHHVFNDLGLKSTGFNGTLLGHYRLSGFDSKMKEFIAAYDAFQDLPWGLFYRELAIEYPESKFILTTRISSEKWFESIKRHSLTTNPFYHTNKWTYGYRYPQFHKNAHINFYEEHNRKVREHFKDKTNFMEICWESGDTIEKIAAFLGINDELILGKPKIYNSIQSRINSRNVRNYNLNFILQYLYLFESKNVNYYPSISRRIFDKLLQSN